MPNLLVSVTWLNVWIALRHGILIQSLLFLLSLIVINRFNIIFIVAWLQPSLIPAAAKKKKNIENFLFCSKLTVKYYLNG